MKYRSAVLCVLILLLGTAAARSEQKSTSSSAKITLSAVKELAPPFLGGGDSDDNTLDLQTPAPADGFRIVNLGNQALAFSYWDGEASWTPVTIGSGGTQSFSCPKCGSTITISFHDGKENKTYAIKAGSTYQMSWSQQTQTWVFAGPLSK
jgi:hypothetical protein